MTEPQENELLGLLTRGVTHAEAARIVGVSEWVFSPQYHDKAFLRRVRAAGRRGRREIERARKSEARESEADLKTIQKEVDHALRGLMTYAAAAEKLGTTRESVRQMAQKGRIPRITVPHGSLVMLGNRK